MQKPRWRVCLVTFVTSRGGGEGDTLPRLAGDAFPGSYLANVDTLVDHTPNDVRTIITYKGKMEHQQHPVVWIKGWHGSPGKSRASGNGNKRKGKGASSGSRGGGT